MTRDRYNQLMTHCGCAWHGQADGPPFSECHYHATLRADLAECHRLLGKATSERDIAVAALQQTQDFWRASGSLTADDVQSNVDEALRQIDAALKGKP